MTTRPERLNQTAALLMQELAGNRDLIRGTAMRVEDELARMSALIAALKAL